MLIIHTHQDEVFDGEESGLVNITQLRAWLEKTREPKPYGLGMANTLDLLSSHEFDETEEERIKFLFENPAEIFKPLILIDSGTPREGYEASIFVIDGWHRLKIFYEVSHSKKLELCKFMGYYVTKADCDPFRIPREMAKLSNVRRKANVH